MEVRSSHRRGSGQSSIVSTGSLNRLVGVLIPVSENKSFSDAISTSTRIGATKPMVP